MPLNFEMTPDQWFAIDPLLIHTGLTVEPDTTPRSWPGLNGAACIVDQKTEVHLHTPLTWDGAGRKKELCGRGDVNEQKRLAGSYTAAIKSGPGSGTVTATDPSNFKCYYWRNRLGQNGLRFAGRIILDDRDKESFQIYRMNVDFQAWWYIDPYLHNGGCLYGYGRKFSASAFGTAGFQAVCGDRNETIPTFMLADNHREICHMRQVSEDAGGFNPVEKAQAQIDGDQVRWEQKRVVMQLFGSFFDGAKTVPQIKTKPPPLASAQLTSNLPTNLCTIDQPIGNLKDWTKCWFNDWALSMKFPVNPGDIIEKIGIDRKSDSKLRAPGQLALYTAKQFLYSTKYPWSAVGCRMVPLAGDNPDFADDKKSRQIINMIKSVTVLICTTLVYMQNFLKGLLTQYGIIGTGLAIKRVGKNWVYVNSYGTLDGE
ncbi:hypothetical protein BV898_05170 [Hypsibius exemplaris]|uniref:Uncharacterized protein n=1 Tax=Hypsibius exemplaris TaxID=2072580 RepID=A0A1W0X027_HYPEX|nr:hypothetical protein BV898_05170 [Hypsibius exemplaris]